MGYSHHWYRVETPTGPLPPEPPHAYGRLALDTITIIRAANDLGIRVADGAATPGSTPVVDEGGIWFNGAPPDDAETFAWPTHAGPDPWWSATPGQRWWDACKTNRQPYDLIVCAVLIRAGTHYGPSIRITSDGNWDGSILDGRDWPEWRPARQLVRALFSPSADRNPLADR